MESKDKQMFASELKRQPSYCLRKSLYEPSEPLWKRVPSRDEFGKPVSDFRMLIVGLKDRSPKQIQSRLKCLEFVFKRHQESIVFADLNLKINLLWVSVRADKKEDINIAAEIHHFIPEAKLLAQEI